MEFTYKNYNFKDDDLFQIYVKTKLSEKDVPRRRYGQFMSQCETQYLRILNSKSLRFSHNIPDDWGYQFLVED